VNICLLTLVGCSVGVMYSYYKGYYGILASCDHLPGPKGPVGPIGDQGPNGFGLLFNYTGTYINSQFIEGQFRHTRESKNGRVVYKHTSAQDFLMWNYKCGSPVSGHFWLISVDQTAHSKLPKEVLQCSGLIFSTVCNASIPDMCRDWRESEYAKYETYHKYSDMRKAKNSIVFV